MNANARKWLTWFSVFAALAYAGMKIFFTYRWWFDGFNFWNEQWRPLPSDDYAMLLGTKWIGTRNLGLGLFIVGALAFKKFRYVGFLLLMGVLVEFFDGFWLAVGRFEHGWVTPHATFYMRGAFIWVPVLLVTGIHMIRYPERQPARAAAPIPDPVFSPGAVAGD